MNLILAPSKIRHDSRTIHAYTNNTQLNDSGILEEDFNTFIEKK